MFGLRRSSSTRYGWLTVGGGGGSGGEVPSNDCEPLKDNIMHVLRFVEVECESSTSDEGKLEIANENEGQQQQVPGVGENMPEGDK